MTRRGAGLAAVLCTGLSALMAQAQQIPPDPQDNPPASTKTTDRTPACNSCDARHQSRKRLRTVPPDAEPKPTPPS